MQTNWGRAVICAVMVPAATVLLTGCGALSGSHGTIKMDDPTGAAAAPAGVTTSASASPAAPSGSATPADGPSAGQAAQTVDNRGCPAGGPAIPKSANRARTGDLDGDGAADSIWLAIDGNDRVLGVSTASGARFSTVFTSDARSTASAVAGRLASGAAIVLLDFPEAE